MTSCPHCRLDRADTRPGFDPALIRTQAAAILATLPTDPHTAHHALEAFLELHLEAALRKAKP